MPLTHSRSSNERQRELLQSRWVRKQKHQKALTCVHLQVMLMGTVEQPWKSEILFPPPVGIIWKWSQTTMTPLPHSQVSQELFSIFLPSCCDFASSHQGLFPNKDEESCYWCRKTPVCKETEAGHFRTMKGPPHELKKQPSWEAFCREKNCRKRKTKRVEISIVKLSFFTSSLQHFFLSGTWFLWLKRLPIVYTFWLCLAPSTLGQQLFPREKQAWSCLECT